MEHKATAENFSTLPERERLSKELLICRDYMPYVPPLVLKVFIPKDNHDDPSTLGNSDVVNNMLELLSTAKFNV